MNTDIFSAIIRVSFYLSRHRNFDAGGIPLIRNIEVRDDHFPAFRRKNIIGHQLVNAD